MPEVNPPENLEMHRQCEIRRPSERGYYFDIVWIKNDLAKKNSKLVDDDGNTWTIAEIYGSKPMPASRMNLKPIMGT